MLNKLCRRGLNILRRFFYVRITDVVVQVQLQSTDFTYFKSPQGLEIRQFDRELDQIIATQLSPTLFLDFSKRASRSIGYILWQDSEAVGYLWSTDHARTKEGEKPFLYDIDPPPHARYFYDLQVLPKCRLKGAGTALMIAALKDAALSGKTTVFATRASWNLPIAHIFKKLGFKETGSIELKRVLGLARRDLRALYV